MICDLRTILDGWEFEPGKISVRKIIGRGGTEKIQTRIDLGVLQIELDGRPDGRWPHDHESCLDHLMERLASHIDVYGNDEEFVLGPEDCQELRQESYLYYQRYLSLFVLEDYERVIRDTARNLRVIDFCERYAAAADDRRALTDQRPYVLMMHTRARVYAALARQDSAAALAAADEGLAAAAGCNGAEADEVDAPPDGGTEVGRPEVRILAELREEVLSKLPPNAPARLQWELQAALAREDYERAARLRDALGARRP